MKTVGKQMFNEKDRSGVVENRIDGGVSNSKLEFKNGEKSLFDSIKSFFQQSIEGSDQIVLAKMARGYSGLMAYPGHISRFIFYVTVSRTFLDPAILTPPYSFRRT